jgi:hypothetical protein
MKLTRVLTTLTPLMLVAGGCNAQKMINFAA